uniref:Kazal-like domain-containing protein n=1 Tax=Kryptolebias marmoratus TaxID=37003 RepID=A0A3Q3EF61_KRYMA
MILNLRQLDALCDSELQCHKNYNPVCGSNGDTYQNECYRRQASCKQQRLISRTHDGPCSSGESRKYTEPAEFIYQFHRQDAAGITSLFKPQK